jgi:hypothetical protein
VVHKDYARVVSVYVRSGIACGSGTGITFNVSGNGSGK